MKILVTGAAGFVGREVVRETLAHGHDVVQVDPRLHWDLYQGKDWSGVDAVIHLGAKTGVRTPTASPYEYYKANLSGTLEMLEQARAYGIRRFVLASTSSVYGSKFVACSENYDTSRPLSPYAASKKAAELLAHTYHHAEGMHVTILRYFTVYGPHGRGDMAIPKFIHAIEHGDRLHVNGNGKQERDFTHVSDIARGTVAAVECQGFNVINLGSGRPVTVNHVIEQLGAMIGKEARVEYGEPHPFDVLRTWANIERAKTFLDWEPHISLEDGLKGCVEAYREPVAV